MKEADDLLAGNGVGVRSGLGDFIGHGSRSATNRPALPGLVKARKEKVPEIGVVVAGIEPVEGLRLLRIGSRAEDRPIFRSNEIHLEFR
ncbi:hypothetical protein D3C87_1596550 [compost metagenome]